MGMHGEPKFAVGDRVVSFRGEYATVTAVRDSEHPGKSNRIYVHFDADWEPCKIEFYETVFYLCGSEFDKALKLDIELAIERAKDEAEIFNTQLEADDLWYDSQEIYNAHDPFGNTL